MKEIEIVEVGVKFVFNIKMKRSEPLIIKTLLHWLVASNR